MKRYLKALLIAITMFANFTSHAHIKTDSSLKTFKDAILFANSSDLIIFDIDEVIVMPKDQIFHPYNREYLKTLEKDFTKDLPCEKAMELWSKALLSRKLKLVDNEIISILEILHSRKIPTIALTNYRTGTIGKINKAEDLRIQEFKALGVSFTGNEPYASPHAPDREFKSLERNGIVPIMKDNIIFSGSHDIDKTKVLKEYLKDRKFKPRKIIYIDDKIEYLHSVEAICKELYIKFLGIEYTAVMNSERIPLNEARAKFQFKNLVKEGIWLDDMEADKRMKN